MSAFILMQYREAGCQAVIGVNLEMEQELVRRNKAVKESLCVNGCLSFKNGSCEAYKKLIAMKPLSATRPIFNEPVRDEAKRLGLSISEVRKMRRGG